MQQEKLYNSYKYQNIFLHIKLVYFEMKKKTGNVIVTYIQSLKSIYCKHVLLSVSTETIWNLKNPLVCTKNPILALSRSFAIIHQKYDIFSISRK